MAANNLPKINKPRDPGARLFSGDNIASIIKYSVLLLLGVCLYGISLQGIKVLKFQQPIVATQHQVDSAVAKVVKTDTITVPVEYKYKDSHFVSNGDTTYWFYTGNVHGPKDYYSGFSRTIKLTSSYFDFYEAGEWIKKQEEKSNSAYIESFIQISKASYLSYKKYCKANS